MTKSILFNLLALVVLFCSVNAVTLAHGPENQHDVYINIHPGSDPSTIYAFANGVIPVAILGSDEFDVMDIDPETLNLASSGVKTVGKNDKPLCHIEDLGSHDEDEFDNLGYPDGRYDLICQFYTTDVSLILGIMQWVHLTGEFLDEDGTFKPFAGTDLVNEPTVLDGQAVCCEFCQNDGSGNGTEDCQVCSVGEASNCGGLLRICDGVSGRDRENCTKPATS